MTTLAQLQMIGKDAQIALGGLLVDVTVKDGKVSYGRQRWLVKPKAGTGEIWVEAIITKASNYEGLETAGARLMSPTETAHAHVCASCSEAFPCFANEDECKKESDYICRSCQRGGSD